MESITLQAVRTNYAVEYVNHLRSIGLYYYTKHYVNRLKQEIKNENHSYEFRAKLEAELISITNKNNQ